MALAMNQSLTPTKLGSKNPLSPSNYPDKRSLVAAYKRMVQMVLENKEDRDNLQQILKEFHNSFLVEDLVENLKELLNEPKRRQLYLAIRPLIPSRLRPEYNSLIPHIPSFEKKVVHLKQQGNRSLGFTIRGGKEFGCGIYISSVLPSSKAAQSGLKTGDELVRVNGLTLVEATHEEVVNLIKLRKTLTLTLKTVGMIPEQKPGSFKISWKTVVEAKNRRTSAFRQAMAGQGPILRSTKRIQLTLDSSRLFGATIKTASDRPENGVFIAELIPNSVAHNAGLKIGDEIIDVNGQSLIGKTHSEAIKLLKSSESLVLTVRVEELTRFGGSSGSNTGHFDPLANPPEDFELAPKDFDIDAELIPTDLDQSTGFVLMPKDQEAAERNLKKAREIERNQKTNRLSLLDMETEQSKNAPSIASPAAFGYGPALTMPTLMGMMPDMPPLDQSGEGQNLDNSLISAPSFSPERMQPGNVRDSVALDMSNFGSGQMPTSIANIFQGGEQETERGEVKPQQQKQEPPPVKPKPKRPSVTEDEHKEPTPPVPQSVQQLTHQPTHKISGADLASYQFPVDDEEEEEEEEEEVGDTSDGPVAQHTPSHPSLNKQPCVSALKKSPSDGGTKPKKTPAFRDKVEIINDHEQLHPSASVDTLGDTVHPSNMDFSEEVLKGRHVAFHTVPKDGPIKVAIRGGTDTPLGGQVIISRILEGGAADRYGRLNVGDQILVCDGVSLIDVTHDEAAQALKRAMDMESNSIDLVVAVNPDVEEQEDRQEPRTLWPLPEDTVCDDQPSSSTTGHDFAKSSRRAHSGFTLRGKGATTQAHAFLPTVPNQ